MKIPIEEYELRKRIYSFTCPNCGGIHFGATTDKETGEVEVVCHGVETPNAYNLPGQPACGWRGPHSEYVKQSEEAGEEMVGTTEGLGLGAGFDDLYE